MPVMRLNAQLKCQTCGEKHVPNADGSPQINCAHCGAALVVNKSLPAGHQSKTKLTLLLLFIPLLVIALMVVFWISFQKTRKHPSYQQPTPAETVVMIKKQHYIELR